MTESDVFDAEALSLDHGTIDGRRTCGEHWAPGKCRRCEAERKLAEMGFVRKSTSRTVRLLRMLVNQL